MRVMKKNCEMSVNKIFFRSVQFCTVCSVTDVHLVIAGHWNSRG